MRPPERRAAQSAASTATARVGLTEQDSPGSAFSAQSSLPLSKRVSLRCNSLRKNSIWIPIASGEGSPGRTGAPIRTRTWEPKSLKRRSYSTCCRAGLEITTRIVAWSDEHPVSPR